MCGKYRVSTEEENIELREIITSIQEKHPNVPICTSDVLPSQIAPALSAAGAEPMTWGFIPLQRKGLIINARCETAAHIPMFKDALAKRRCLLPASVFYEWDKQKTCYCFAMQNSSIMYIAGLYTAGAPLSRFVILTRTANDTVSPIHDRMPFILPSPEYQKAWLYDNSLAPDILRALPTAELCIA